MPNNFTIIIEGIALIYTNPPVWKVLFPFDREKCHGVRFSGKGWATEQVVTLAEPGRTVSVTATGPSGMVFDDKIDPMFLDLTSTVYGHPDIRKNRDWHQHAVLLTFEGGTLSMQEESNCRYRVINSPRGYDMAYKQIAYSAKLQLAGDTLRVVVSGENGFEREFKDDAELTFDNNCRREIEGDSSDLDMIYGLLEPIDRMRIERDPKQMPPDRMAAVLNNNNPEPGQKGLPCNGYVSSMPGDLP